MADVMDNILNQLNKIGETVVDKSGFYFRKAVDKGEELSRIGRIQLEIEKTKREIKVRFARLGTFVFQQNSVGDISDIAATSEFLDHISEIEKLKCRITEKEQEKEAARSQNDPEPVIVNDNQ